jgi:hypothetical protein
MARRGDGPGFLFRFDDGAPGKVACADAITGAGGASTGRMATVSFDEGLRSRLDGACDPSSGMATRVPISGVIDRPLVDAVDDRFVTASDRGLGASIPLSAARLAAASTPFAGRRLGSRSIIRSTAAAIPAGTSLFSRWILGGSSSSSLLSVASM